MPKLTQKRRSGMTPRRASWGERLKWAEEMGLKSLEEKAATADNLNKEAQTTLTYVLAGMGGTFVYIVHGLTRSLDTILFATIFLCFYFFLLGLYLVFRTFLLSDYPSPYQEPANLVERPELTIEVVRYGEILNMTERLEESKAWIEKKARAINLARIGLVISPLLFALGCLLFKAIG